MSELFRIESKSTYLPDEIGEVLRRARRRIIRLYEVAENLALALCDNAGEN
jgi:hypothetical protein